MIQYKIIYDQAHIHVALISGCLWEGNTYIITKAVNIGFREIYIDSTATLEHLTSIIHQNCESIFPYFGPNVYANAFLHIRSYAPAYVYSLTYQYFMLSALFPQEKKIDGINKPALMIYIFAVQ